MGWEKKQDYTSGMGKHATLSISIVNVSKYEMILGQTSLMGINQATGMEMISRKFDFQAQKVNVYAYTVCLNCLMLFSIAQNQTDGVGEKPASD